MNHGNNLCFNGNLAHTSTVDGVGGQSPQIPLGGLLNLSIWLVSGRA